MNATPLPPPLRPEQRHRGGHEAPADTSWLPGGWRSEAFAEDLPVAAAPGQPGVSGMHLRRQLTPWLMVFVAAAGLPWGR